MIRYRQIWFKNKEFNNAIELEFKVSIIEKYKIETICNNIFYI